MNKVDQMWYLLHICYNFAVVVNPFFRAVSYFSFCSMKWLLPGWDASPSQGFSQHLNSKYLFIHLNGYWGTVRVNCLAQEQNTMFPARAETQTARNGENKYKNQITSYLHRLLITFKMYNDLFGLELGHCF